MTTEACQQGSSSATACAKPPRCEDRTGSKGAEILNSVPPGYEPSYAEGAPSAPSFIIGFDAEWVEVQDEPSDDPDSEPADPPPHNLVLSYQYACRHHGEAWSGIIYTRAGARIRHPNLTEKELAQWPERLNFAVLLAQAISAGVDAGHIRRWPKHVIATAHWTRADLSGMANHAEIKGQFDGVQKTYVTLSKHYRARVSIGKRIRSFQVTLVDTQLLAPGSSKSLEALGDLYGFPKHKPGNAAARGDVPYITHMDWLIADDAALYEAYAIRDAEISALHVDQLDKFVREDLGLDSRPITLGGISADVLLKYWRDDGIDDAQVNGYVRVKETHFNRAYTTLKSKRYLTKPGRRYNDNYMIHRELATRCFHGGRNECFAYGPTSDMAPSRLGGPVEVYCPSVETPVRWREFDLKGAYATSLSALRIPDYDAARATSDPADFDVSTLGFARVRFQFPMDCRFPCLAVEAECDRGLIYPLSGEAYATAPEIALALSLGGEIEILNGVVIPWLPESPCIFQKAIRDLRRRREAHRPKTILNEMFKQLGNGIYGKLGQGIKGTTAYNTRTDTHDEIGESKVTNPYLAAHVTGLIRALLGELIASAGTAWTVISATTDSIVTNCQFSEVNLTGPVASYMIRVAEELEGRANHEPGRGILEQKSETSRLLPWRTRGIATLSYEKDYKLARAGMRAPRGVYKEAENAWFVCAMSDRYPGMKYTSSEPPSFPHAHRLSADHVFRNLEKSCNFEYDFKRRPVTPVPKYLLLPQPGNDGSAILCPKHNPSSSEPEEDIRIVQHLSFNTIPWETIDEFNKERKLFEAFRLKYAGQLKTLQDWDRWERFKAGAAASHSGVRRSKSGPAGQALQLFRRAYARKLWGLRDGQDRGGTYRLAAEALTAAGFPTKEQDFKNAKRIGDGLPENTIPVSDPQVIALIRAILTIWPEFEWQRMVDGTCADLEICAPATPARAAETLGSVVPAYEPSYALMYSLTGAHPGRSALADRPTPSFAGYTVDELEAGWGICADQGA